MDGESEEALVPGAGGDGADACAKVDEGFDCGLCIDPEVDGAGLADDDGVSDVVDGETDGVGEVLCDGFEADGDGL